MNYPRYKILLIFLVLMLHQSVQSQNYHALNGSKYAGVFGMYNNPASTVNAPMKWDLNVFSLQGTTTNSLIAFNHFSLSNFDSTTVNITEGKRSRFFNAAIDMNILNLRLAIGRNKAIAFGLRGRTYNHVKTSTFTAYDSITSFSGFLHANTNTDYLSGFATHAGWIEGDINYSQVWIDDARHRVSGGITLGIMRGLSGAFSQVNKLTYREYPDAQNNYYQIITGGTATAEYSKNYDLTDTNAITAAAIKSFLKNTRTAFSLSFGMEYLIKKDEIDETKPGYETDYNWKIGVSIMDIGANTFDPAGGSFYAGIPKTNITADRLRQQFLNATSLKKLRDSLLQTMNLVDTLSSEFSITMPTRLLISVDKNLNNNFYINGQLNVNFYSAEPYNKIKTRELNLVTITPRWETRTWGVYLPVQYNAQGQLWAGAALKAGPLLIGIHNVGWLFGKMQQLNGGGYIALHFTPAPKKIKTRLDCPVE